MVSGYSAALTDGAGAIRVRYAELQRGQVKFNEQAARPELFEHRLFPGQDWEAPFYRSLAEEEGVDAVLLLGGAKSTLIAGQIAIARGLPILPVDEFGGSAAKVWNQLAQASPNKTHHTWGTRPVSSFVNDLKNECISLATNRAEARHRDQLLAAITGRRNQASYAAGAFIAWMCTLYFGMVSAPSPTVYPFVMLVGLIAGGATGALVRAILSEAGNNDPRLSLLLGGIAGLVVGLAYLIPQWVGAPGPLATGAATVTATDKI